MFFKVNISQFLIDKKVGLIISNLLMLKSVDFDEFSPRKCKFVSLIEVLKHGGSNVVCRIQIQGFLQIVVGHVHHANLHARARSIHIVFRIVGKEVNCTTEFNISTLVVLLIETLGAYSVMCQ